MPCFDHNLVFFVSFAPFRAVQHRLCTLCCLVLFCDMVFLSRLLLSIPNVVVLASAMSWFDPIILLSRRLCTCIRNCWPFLCWRSCSFEHFASLFMLLVLNRVLVLIHTCFLCVPSMCLCADSVSFRMCVLCVCACRSTRWSRWRTWSTCSIPENRSFSRLAQRSTTHPVGLPGLCSFFCVHAYS